LNVDTIRANKITTIDDHRRLEDLFGRKWKRNNGGALVFPYHGESGEIVLQRAKPDVPPKIGGKPAKYLQPRGQKPRAYFPNGVRELLANIDQPLTITEGEKKALMLHQSGFAAIGIMGVDCWHEKRSARLLADLERVNWKGRRVFIAFDSDAVENENVRANVGLLSAALERMGAIPKVVWFPPGPNGEKVGADDFLVANGAPAFAALMAKAEQPEAVDPMESKARAETIEPASTAAAFLAEREFDGVPKLRYWRGSFHIWIGGRWIEIENSEAQADLVRSINRNFVFLTTGVIANLMAQLKAQAALPSRVEPPSWLGTPPVDWPAHEVIASSTELLHIPSLVVGRECQIPATPRYFTQTAIDYPIRIDAPEPELWLAFLDQIWHGDQESIDALQEWFGYLLVPDTRLQKILQIIGPPRAGKGVIARVLTSLVGRSNVAGPTLASLETNFGLAPMLGKSVAIIADARLSGRVDAGKVVERLLSISGEDALTIDRKFREGVTGKLPTRIVIISNELPRLAESSGALAGRMIILRLVRSFVGAEDTRLTDKLTAELPGILLWAIGGWQRLHERGHFLQPSSALEMAAEMRDLSSPVGTFIRERCELGPGYEVSVADIFDAWGNWTKENGYEHTIVKSVFCRDLRAAQPQLVLRRSREGEERWRVYEGISLLR
jgi:putative DNA primase/helicase